MPSNQCPERNRPVSEPNDYEVTPVVVFLPGFWHRAVHFDRLRRPLEARGVQTEALDLPRERPDIDIEEMAEDIADKIDTPETTSLWGHSNSGNLLPRVAAVLEDRSTPLSHLGLLNAAFEWTNDHHFGYGDETNVPQKYTRWDYLEHVQPYELDPGLTIYDPTLVRDHFYNGCTEEDTDWAVGNLRPQYRSESPLPPFTKWPSTPATSIIGTKDRIINPDYSRYVADVIGAEKIEVDTGHSGYISHPELHAEIIYKKFNAVLKSLVTTSFLRGEAT